MKNSYHALHCRRARGITVVEMALIMMIIGLLPRPCSRARSSIRTAR